MRLNPNDFADANEAGTFLLNYTKKGARRVQLEAGTFDVSGPNPTQPLNWYMPPGTRLECHELAILKSKVERGEDSCNFQLNDRVVIDGGTLLAPLTSKKHVCCVGFGGAGAFSSASATLRNVTILGGNFQVYLWAQNAIGCKLVMRQCRVRGGRWLVTNGNTGGSNAFDLEMFDCLLYGNYQLGWGDPVAAQGNRLHGISGRGGTTRVRGGEIVLEGFADATDVRGAWTPLAQSQPGQKPDYEGGHPDALIDMVGVNIRVIGNGAKNAQPTEQGVGQIWTDGCSARAA